jgi:integrase/recombinase XerD
VIQVTDQWGNGKPGWPRGTVHTGLPAPGHHQYQDGARTDIVTGHKLETSAGTVLPVGLDNVPTSESRDLCKNPRALAHPGELPFSLNKSERTPPQFGGVDGSARFPFRTGDSRYARVSRARSSGTRFAEERSFFRHVALREPAAMATAQQVLAIPHKRFDRALVSFLTEPEIDALLEAPDRDSWLGARDHALLLVGLQTGLRVSELIGLTRGDVHLGRGAYVRCSGKGRKERCTPLRSQSRVVLRAWLKRHDGGDGDPVFPSRRGAPLSRDAVERLVTKYTAKASPSCPTLRGKVVSPHVLRHTSAMQLLHGGVDRSTIALWLGHECVETTQMYLHADMSIKERALARTAPPRTGARRYRPPDALLAFLEAL